MAIALLQFLGLASIIVVAGIVLTYCADIIAEATGLGRLLVGSILLSGATSLPELSVDLAAIRLGAPDLAVGDLLGSSLMNLLILASLDLLYWSRGKMLSRMSAAHALSGLFSVSLTALVGLGLLTTRSMEDWSFLGLHVWTWAIAAAYLMGVRVVYLDQRIAVAKVSAEAGGTAEAEEKPNLWKGIVGFAVAAVIVMVTGPYLATSAEHIAELSGLGDSFVGTTFVAISTSLPELASSITAVRLGAYDLIIGNVFGSNAFNMLLFVPLDAAYSGALFAVAGSSNLISAFGAILATCIVVIGQLYHVERRMKLIEPDALLVILVISVCFGLVYMAK